MTPKGQSVLLVDDNIEWLETMMEALQSEGYSVRAAVRGTQALSILEYFKPDVIVTDLRMPIMDGEQLLGKLQARRPRFPIIVVTGESSRLASPKLKDVFDVIEKPASLDRLLAAVAAAAATKAQDGGSNE
jgi:DNA-binding NtrC family response regulator